MVAQTTYYLLTGDIGGTNSRMALYLLGNRTALIVKTYRNFDCMTKKEDGIFQRNIIAPFLKFCWEEIKNISPVELTEIISCLAIAGPVKNNKVIMSNLHGIEISGDDIAGHTHYSCDEESTRYLQCIQVCKVINDFVAQGYGCLTLKREEVVELTPGSLKMLDPKGPKACVGAGTGLGECFLAPDELGVYSCFASEGGHVEWAPRSKLEVKLWKFLNKKFANHQRVSVERVVSGTGLANIYEFFAQEFPQKVNQKVQAEFIKAGDMKGKVVATNAKKCELCELTMSTFATAYGSEVGCVGIKLIPTGGLYVTGGLTPKNMNWIEGKDSHFMQAYNDKGRVSPILENVPLLAVMVEDLGVRGALKNAQSEYYKFEARKNAKISRTLSYTGTTTDSYTDLVSVDVKSSCRVKEMEKEAAYYKRLAHITLAFTSGLVAGLTFMKSKK